MKKHLLEFLWVALPKVAVGLLTVLLNLTLIRLLTPHEYGAFALCLATVILVDAVFGGSVDFAVLKLAPPLREAQPAKARAVELAALLLKLGIVLALMPVIVWLAPVIADHVLGRPGGLSLIWLTALAILALLAMRSTLAHYQVECNFKAYATTDWVSLSLRFGGSAGLIALAVDQADAYMAAVAAGALSGFLLNLHRIWSSWRSAWRQWQSAVPDLLQLMIWYFPTVAIGAILSKLDLYVLGGLVSIQDVGVFSAAAAVATIPELFGSYLGVLIAPRVMAAMQSPQARALFLKIQGGLLLLSLLSLAMAWWLLPYLLGLWFPDQYLAAIPVVQVLLIGAFAIMLALPLVMPMLLFQRPRWLLTLDAGIFIPTLLGYYFAIDQHGILGAAWVTAISRLIRLGISHLFAFQLLRQTRTTTPADQPQPQPQQLSLDSGRDLKQSC